MLCHLGNNPFACLWQPHKRVSKEFFGGQDDFLLVLLKNGVDSAIEIDLGLAFQHNTSPYCIRAYRNSVSTANIILNRGAS